MPQGFCNQTVQTAERLHKDSHASEMCPVCLGLYEDRLCKQLRDLIKQLPS